ncbi:MAG: phosphate--nucleotide phosphotransferase [Acidobacteria bacterium RIFCSPLOWO2_02_FULL_65_29]|nr:MAG: phosphate--nucleotide phosphotransferase [Acidobacteria bacterium RIFCSPLOWO2_02_FULL_65_29]
MKTKIDADRFRVRQGSRLRLTRCPTDVAPVYDSKDHYGELLERQVDQLSELQERLYAADSYALLLIFQAMDAAGKDGVLKHVMSGINPQGCQVFSFKHPSATDLDHDFLWRTTTCLPERGRIGIFNRSYYEEVLVVRVHPNLVRGQRIPGFTTARGPFWKDRYQSIVDFERHLGRNGTRIVKFYLHLSKKEQRKRLLARIEDSDKNWKFSVGDLEERRLWRQYMAAYEACMSATSTAEAPWYAVPADDKKNARLIVSQAIIDALTSLKLTYPELDAAARRQLKEIGRQLAK